MRTMTIMGLTSEAEKWLQINAEEEVDLLCPNCRCVISKKLKYEIYSTPDCWYGEGPSLKKYSLKNGGIAREIIQSNSWSSGPCIFLCLEVEDSGGTRKMFQWPDEELNEV